MRRKTLTSERNEMLSPAVFLTSLSLHLMLSLPSSLMSLLPSPPFFNTHSSPTIQSLYPPPFLLSFLLFLQATLSFPPSSFLYPPPLPFPLYSFSIYIIFSSIFFTMFTLPITTLSLTPSLPTLTSFFPLHLSPPLYLTFPSHVIPLSIYSAFSS